MGTFTEIFQQGLAEAKVKVSEAIAAGNGTGRQNGIVGFDLLEDLEAVIDYKSAVLYLREDTPRG